MPHTIRITQLFQYDNFVFCITFLGDLQHLIVLKSPTVEACVFNSISLSSLIQKLFHSPAKCAIESANKCGVNGNRKF